MSIDPIKRLASLDPAGGFPGSGVLAVTATVLEAEGSTPRGSGSRLVLLPDGALFGTVGGGKVEGLAIERARGLLATGGRAELRLDLSGREVLGSEMICGGRVLLALESVTDPAPFAAAARLLAEGRSCVLVSFLAEERRCVLDEEGRLVGAPPAGGFAPEAAVAAEVLATGRARLAGQGRGAAFYEALAPEDRLLVLGAGHVGRALALLAPALGFSVTVADPRPELADPARFPAGVEVLARDFVDAIRDFPFGPRAYAVVVSPGHLADLDCVRAVLGREYKYAGFIGSRRKVRMILDEARREGFDPARVEALHAPIGLDIGAETPEEIAVAVLAEMIAVRRASPNLACFAEERTARRNAK